MRLIESRTDHFPADRLIAYQIAKQVLAEVARLSTRWPAHLRDQAERACTSVLLNIAEGASQPRGTAAKRRHYDIALASAGEVAAILDAAEILGRSPAAKVQAIRTRASRLGALIAGLVRAHQIPPKR